MSNFSEILQKTPLVLIDFFADWCGPCKAMSPILSEVKKEVGQGVSIVKINVDNNQALVAKYQVKGVPTLLLFKEEKQVWRTIWSYPKRNDG